MATNQEYLRELLPQETTSEAIVSPEPLLMSGPNPKLKNSPHADREARARALAAAWGGTVKDFVLARYSEIVQVREDFLNKAKSKTICGCNTWEEYVTQALHCSPQHMRRLLHGDNPATAIHDGSANRKPTPVTETPSTDETAAPSPSRAPAIDLTPGAEGETGEAEQTEATTPGQYAGAKPRKDRDYFCRIGRALDNVLKGQLKERLDELSQLEQEQITKVAEKGINEIILILKEVSETAGSYATTLEMILQSKKGKAA